MLSGHISKKEAKILGFKVDNRRANVQHRTKFVSTLTRAEQEAYVEQAKRNAMFTMMKGQRNQG